MQTLMPYTFFSKNLSLFLCHVYFPTFSLLQLTFTLVLCDTYSHFSLITFSNVCSPCYLSDMSTWVMPVLCYLLSIKIYLGLSCLVKRSCARLVCCLWRLWPFTSLLSVILWLLQEWCHCPTWTSSSAKYNQDRCLLFLLTYWLHWLWVYSWGLFQKGG